MQDHVSNKDLSYSMSSELTSTSPNSTDNKLEIDEVKNQLKELTSLLKDQKINATYPSNNRTDNPG